jgi:hypothetical protein
VPIVQISRITNRKGLTENLPQLAGAELGWCTDSRRLFIGNGTIQSGAPVIGNTEILTEFSDITVLSDYTYSDIVVGYAAQTGPTPSDPVVRSVQAKLDDQASVRDFGAQGDGVTDDTQAINRALFQLYCREINTQIRRSLFFPAGTYRVTDTIIIPSYARLVGEGADSSIILLDPQDSSVPAYVARYGDSLQQVGANIGVGGAVAPRDIEISAMGFQTNVMTDVFLVQDAEQSWFAGVNFRGALTMTDIQDPVDPPDMACVRFASTPSNRCRNIIFDRCGFSHNTRGIATAEALRGVAVSNSSFTVLRQGVVLADQARGFRLVHNVFDDIYAEAVVYDAPLNATGYNAFFNVGNSLNSVVPTHAAILFRTDNAISIGDMFERSPVESVQEPPIQTLITEPSQGTSRNQLGRYSRESGQTVTLLDAQANQPIFQMDSLFVQAFDLYYTTVRSNQTRSGTLRVVSQLSGGSTTSQRFTDDYSETDDVGVTLTVTQVNQTVTVLASTTATGATAVITFSVCNLA